MSELSTAWSVGLASIEVVSVQMNLVTIREINEWCCQEALSLEESLKTILSAEMLKLHAEFLIPFKGLDFVQDLLACAFRQHILPWSVW